MINKAKSVLDTPTDKQILVIMSEIGMVADKLANIGSAVSILGSARLHEASSHYAKCKSIFAFLTKASFAVIAGDRPDLMEVTNKSAYEVDSTSVG